MKPLFMLLLLIGAFSSYGQETISESESAPPVAEAPAEVSEPLPESLASAVPAVDEPVIPQAYPSNRYEASWSKNPFLLKTVAPPQAKDDFSKDWALAAMSRMGSKDIIYISNKQTGESKRLTNQDGADAEFRLIEAKFSRNREEAYAKVAKGNEEAELKYDENLTSKPLTINNTLRANGAQPGTPGGVPGNPNARPQGQPGAPVSPANQARLQQPGAVQAGQSVPGINQMGGVQNVTGAVQPGGVAPNAVVQPGANPSTPPTISRRRQLIPAPVVPAQQ